MHAVTKILVVFAVVLSILLSALTVAFSANAERIKGQYQSIEADRNSVLTDKRASDAQHSDERARLQGEIDSVNQQLNAVISEKASVQQESSRLLAQAKQAELQLQSVQARIDRLAATGSTQAILISSYRDELSSLRQGELHSKQREIQLADQINDLSGQLEVSIEASRALQEQLAELQQQSGTAQASSRRGLPAAGALIRARITKTQLAPNGDLLAEIDAGTNDRLSNNMELTIVQDNRFAGVLTLTSVDLNQAVGRVSLNRGQSIRQGSYVTTIR